MPKPKSKKELQELSQGNYQKLIELIHSFPKEVWNREFQTDKLYSNMRDVVAHLHHWHLMFLEWYDVGMQGKKPDMPAKGFTWKTVPDLNRKIWEEYLETSLENVLESFEQSYTKVQEIISQHSNEELFTKKKYKWTGSTSLGAYLISNTSSHYNWAIKTVRKSM